jgi:hypothetical protein
MVGKAEVWNMRRIAMMAWLLAVGCGGSEFGTNSVGSDAAVGGAGGATAGAAGSQPYDGGGGSADAFTGGSGGAAGQSDASTPDGSAGATGGSAGEAGAGGADAQPTCSQNEHLCGDQCVENTPDNGCAVQCVPCAAPDNAYAVCGSQGECAWECDAGCEQTAAGCVCPVHECCDHGECATSGCWSGICQVGNACHLDKCRSWCVFCLGKTDGFCNSGDECQCEN